MTIHTLFLIAAIICFIIATAGISARVNLVALGLALGFAAFLIVGCANPPVAAPNQPAVVNDAIELTQQATNAYIAAKSGNTDYVYSIADGLRAYSTVMRTAQDVKAVLKQYSDGKSAGLSFIDNLAHIWTSSPLPPEKKAEVLAQAAEKAALGTAP